jgi:sulfur carrier protein ThiS
MTVQVKWFPTLVKRTKSQLDRTEVDWRAGLTPFDVFAAEGFNVADMEAVMVVINDEQMEADTLLTDNDKLEFLVSIQGG